APQQRAHLLRAQVVGVVVARREGERSEQDAPLDLVAEADVARLAVERGEGPRCLRARAVARAAVAREAAPGRRARGQVRVGGAGREGGRAGCGRVVEAWAAETREEVGTASSRGSSSAASSPAPASCRATSASSKRRSVPGSTPSATKRRGTPIRSPRAPRP